MAKFELLDLELKRRRKPWVQTSAARDLESGPVGQDLFGFFYFILRTGKIESQFPGSARDDYFDGGQTAALHSQVELFVSFMGSVALETCHGSGSTSGEPIATQMDLTS